MDACRPTPAGGPAAGSCGCGDRCPALSGTRCGCGCPCLPAPKKPAPRALSALAAAAAADGDDDDELAGLARAAAAGAGAEWAVVTAVDPDTCWSRRAWAGAPPPPARAALAALADAALAARPPTAAAHADAAAHPPSAAAMATGVKAGGGCCCGGKAVAAPAPVRFFTSIPVLPLAAPVRAAGVPPLGLIAVASPSPRDLTSSHAAALAAVARRAAALLARRARAAADAATAAGARRAFDAAAAPTALVDAGEPGWPMLLANSAWAAAVGGGGAAPRTPLWSLLRPMEGRPAGPAATGDAYATQVARGAPFSVRVAVRRGGGGGEGGARDAVMLPRPRGGEGDAADAAPPPPRCRHAPARMRVGPAAVTVVLAPVVEGKCDDATSVASILDAMPPP